ncbi:MAG: TIGR04222 domain-containing membrane protein, partial [Planctomycetota bacterium]
MSGTAEHIRDQPQPAARDTELWRRIAAHPFDDPASDFPFTRRLARDNRWSVGYAVRVVEEYRRFCYLACTAGHPVTPSDEVDQAWHLHLLYTRDYWDEFCPSVLGRPLHHGPTRGGDQEAAKFDDWYARTLASYREHFDRKPPADIWPTAKVRFNPKRFGLRVLPNETWLIAKPWVRRTGLRAAALVATGVTSALAPSSSAWAQSALQANPLDWPARPFLELFAVLAGVSVLLAWLPRYVVHAREGPGDRSPDPQHASELDPYEVASLAGGDNRVVATAVAYAHAAGDIRVVGKKLEPGDVPLTGDDWASRIQAAVAARGRFKDCRRAVRDLLAMHREQLQEEGLLRPRSKQRMLRDVPI